MKKLKSRKFWIAVAGALSPIAGQMLSSEIPPEQALTLSAGVLISYLLGQSHVDAAQAKADKA